MTLQRWVELNLIILFIATFLGFITGAVMEDKWHKLKGMFAFIAFWVIVRISAVIWIIAVAVHFIRKYW